MPGDKNNDQVKIVTPHQALIKNKVDAIVMGRSITKGNIKKNINKLISHLEKMYVKICGIKDHDTLKYLIKHRHKPKFIGFISNYKKSHRYLDLTSLKKLININKKGVNFVAVLVKPKITFLEKIKSLPFDYYQLYDVSPSMTRLIKKKYQIKIISSITIKKFRDIQIYKKYENISDIVI